MHSSNLSPSLFPFNQLSTDLKLTIFEKLNGKDIISACEVCKEWKQVIDKNQEILFRKAIEQDFGYSEEQILVKPQLSYKENYLYNCVRTKEDRLQRLDHYIKELELKYVDLQDLCTKAEDVKHQLSSFIIDPSEEDAIIHVSAIEQDVLCEVECVRKNLDKARSLEIGLSKEVDKLKASSSWTLVQARLR